MLKSGDLVVDDGEPAEDRGRRIENPLPGSRRDGLWHGGLVKCIVARPQFPPGRFVRGDRVSERWCEVGHCLLGRGFIAKLTVIVHTS